MRTKLKDLLELATSRWRSRGKVKYFCIGRNKTGTTSLKIAFKRLGFSVGNQRNAERLAAKYYFRGDFEPIVGYCRNAQVFQDVPFSYPETYKHLDRAYPGSKFILTVRDDAEQWYQSITRFHSKKFGRDGNLPTSEDLKSATYVNKGFIYNVVRVHGTSDDDPYNKEIMISHYNRYNEEVIQYFKDRPEDFLILNVGKAGEYGRLVDFLKIKSSNIDFPWENKT